MAVEVSNKVSEAALKDIRELESKISRMKSGEMDEERFRSYRLTRGVYGQRQLGVQMFRIKIPYGRITTDQLVAMSHTSDRWASSNLHATTRQNIQFHYVKLDDSPNVWAELEDAGVTGREACGNTVRTITASAKAGVDPKEAFDVSPYAHALSYYFLRNPICQEMGRKFKMAFSSNADDSAFTFMHDLGFTPVIKDGEKGFKVVIGGGLGAQSIMAQDVKDFLPVDQLIPFTEACIRVFDRYGEREKRNKARLKFLVQEKRGIGVAKFLELVAEEQKALKVQTYNVDEAIIPTAAMPAPLAVAPVDLTGDADYDFFVKTNVFEQKQKGFYAVQIKLPLGNLKSDKARAFAAVIKKYAADDIRVTMNQGFLLRFVKAEALGLLYTELKALGLAEGGFDSIADITACPGTDTCNLGVTDSTHIAGVLEDVIQKEYRSLILDSEIKIKMSGCMNACGQHMAAQIGFHGSSIKQGPLVMPAQQVVLGGGVNPTGDAFIAEKVIKLPTKRIPDALRTLLSDYQENANEGEYYNDYVQRQGKKYFYGILKVYGDLSTIEPSDYQDWGENEDYVQEIGVGECAGVTLDVIGTIIKDAEEKLSFALETVETDAHADAIYHAYSTFVVGAKALLLSEDVKCNTHIKILEDFQEQFVAAGKFEMNADFASYVLRLKANEPSADFAKTYVRDAQAFMGAVVEYRKQQVAENKDQLNKVVVDNYYKA